MLNAQVKEAQGVRAELQSSLDKALLDLSYATVRAPFNGVIGNKAVQVGQYVQPGTRLLALVPLDTAYIEANYKETQLDRIRPGQPADVAVDAADGRVYHGVVESIAPASGSQYSLLPPENATGNFTKIVQRVPVRIRVDGDAIREGVLRPGLSVVTYVNTKGDHQAADTASCRARQCRSPEVDVRVRTSHPRVPASKRIEPAAAPMQAAEPQLTARRVVTFVVMVFGMFMAILDIQIVSASLSEIQAGISASADEIPWVQTSYLIAEVIMIPLSGFLSRALSTRYLFVISAAGFTLMSIMCATATSIEEMIVWRALQGFIGGGMIPTVFASAFTIFPEIQAACGPAPHRSRRNARADHRPDDRRLSHRRLLLALAVSRQRAAGDRGDGGFLFPDRFRQAQFQAFAPVRLDRLPDDGGLPRRARIHPGRRADRQLVRQRSHHHRASSSPPHAPYSSSGAC